MVLNKNNGFSNIAIYFLYIVLACFKVTICIDCDVKLHGLNGTIRSPRYPNMYENKTNCMWHIQSPPNSVLTISVEDLDIEPDLPKDCGFQTNMICCQHNWLTLPLSGSGKMHQYCGHNPVIKPINISKALVTLKFHTSKITTGGRGFLLKYNIVSASKESKLCKQTEFQCADEQCIPMNKRCDGISDCNDYSDEHNCDCAINGKMSCFNGRCFNNTQRCDGKQDCDNGRDESNCPASNVIWPCEFKCNTGNGCFKQSDMCDRKPDCPDFSDEIDCGYCQTGQALCNPNFKHCFQPATEKCDGKLDCPFGEDEVGCVPGCDSGIACSSGEGCYLPSQRCNSQSDCADESDEALCPQEFCASIRDKRLCHNGRCLQSKLWCDGSDDCGDGSDENNCVKTSVVAAAIMGSLLCGLLLAIAVACTFRIFGQRFRTIPNYRLHLSPQLASRLRMSHSVSLPALIDDDYFRREPPPSYSVAVGECSPAIESATGNVLNPQQQHLVNQPPTMYYCARISNGRRQRRPLTSTSSTRRQRNQRSQPQRTVTPYQDNSVKTQNVETSDSQCEASSSQSSPSRESLTSSSYLSGSDDNSHLLRS